MVYCVYILECYIDHEFRCYYVGMTSDLHQRMAYHIEAVRNHNTDKYTGRFDFVKRIWYKKVPSKVDALRLEKYLKSLTPDEKEDYMEDN